MAGNNAIQFLRGTSSQRISSNEKLLPGQPFYETDTNKLYLGGQYDNKETALQNANPLNNNLNIQNFWENVTGNSATHINVRVGDRSFVEIGGNMFPALCIHSDCNLYNNSTVWQVSYGEHVFDTWGIDSYESSSLREWLNSEVFTAMPKYLQGKIYKDSLNGHHSNPLWILSAEEIWGDFVDHNEFTNAQGYQFEYYKQLTEDSRATNVDNPKLACNNDIWLRNKDKTGGDNLTFATLKPRGAIGVNDVEVKCSVVFCFIIRGSK